MSLRRRAGIAQLVEQATENRRVPSSNLGPGMLDNPKKPLKQHVLGVFSGFRLLRPEGKWKVSPGISGPPLATTLKEAELTFRLQENDQG